MKNKVLSLSLAVAVAAGTTLCSEASVYSRMEIDVSSLPNERAFFRNVVLSRLWDRTPPSDAAAILTVRFAEDASLSGEIATVKVADSVAEIRGGRFRSMVFGAGLLLRTIRYGEKTFELEDGEYRFEPANPIRIAYTSRHFDNWYQRASAEEVMRYVEDLALWGINGIHTQMDSLDYSVMHFARPTASERAVFEATSVAIGERVSSLDMEQITCGGNNCAPADRSKQFHAVPHRGTSLFNVCPERPGALDYLVSNHKEYLDRIQKLPIKGWIYWPYDEGGCGCERCMPWGGNGYVKLIERLCSMNDAAHPGGHHYVSTWLFDNEDWEMFYKYLENQDWIDAIIVDSHTDFPRYPLEHPVPKNIPVVTFPEISMWGRFPWGGTGANPLPARFERLYRQCQKIAKGFELYSEGIFEDVNKMVVNGMYINPKRSANDVLADYARYELPGCDPSDFVALCAKLENIYETRLYNEDEGYIVNYLVEGDPKELEQRLTVAREARLLAEKIDRSILPTMRRCWRWRQLYLRALIDEAVYATRDIRTPSVIPAYKELAALYHAERQVAGLYNGDWRGWTCPPLADSPDARRVRARRAKAQKR